MKSRSKLIDDFLRAFDDVDVHQLEQIDLSDDELAVVSAGVAALPDPIGAACDVVLDNWTALDGLGRVAALLVLANTLASAT